MKPLHLHYEYETAEDDVIEVTLNMPANVQLMDTSNYEHYSNGKTFHYHGGYAEASPVLITPPRPGRWHLVIDLGGGAGKLRGYVRLLSHAGMESR